jgi:putative transposase
MVLRTRSDTSKKIEILVLRHQLAVLQRRTPHRRMSWTDRGLIVTLARLLPVRRLWVPRTVSRLLTSAFVVAQARRLPAIADQHDRSL